MRSTMMRKMLCITLLGAAAKAEPKDLAELTAVDLADVTASKAPKFVYVEPDCSAFGDKKAACEALDKKLQAKLKTTSDMDVFYAPLKNKALYAEMKKLQAGNKLDALLVNEKKELVRRVPNDEWFVEDKPVDPKFIKTLKDYKTCHPATGTVPTESKQLCETLEAAEKPKRLKHGCEVAQRDSSKFEGDKALDRESCFAILNGGDYAKNDPKLVKDKAEWAKMRNSGDEYCMNVSTAYKAKGKTGVEGACILNPEGTAWDQKTWLATLKEAANGASVVPVRFAAQWCGHCKQMTPFLKQAQQELKEMGYGTRWVDVELGFPGPLNDYVSTKYGIRGFPTTRLINVKTGEPVTDTNGTAVGIPNDSRTNVEYLKKFLIDAASDHKVDADKKAAWEQRNKWWNPRAYSLNQYLAAGAAIFSASAIAYYWDKMPWNWESRTKQKKRLEAEKKAAQEQAQKSIMKTAEETVAPDDGLEDGAMWETIIIIIICVIVTALLGFFGYHVYKNGVTDDEDDEDEEDIESPEEK